MLRRLIVAGCNAELGPPFDGVPVKRRDSPFDFHWPSSPVSKIASPCSASVDRRFVPWTAHTANWCTVTSPRSSLNFTGTFSQYYSSRSRWL